MIDGGGGRFDELLPYYNAVVSFIMRQGFSREDARDLAQEVFIRVYRNMDAWRADSKWGYLQTTARRLAYNAIRDGYAQKRAMILEPEEKLVGLADERIKPADAELESRQASERLHRAVDRLDPSQAQCVRLSLAGFSYDEIAHSLEISESAVKSRLSVARKRLREILEEDLEGFGEEP